MKRLAVLIGAQLPAALLLLGCDRPPQAQDDAAGVGAAEGAVQVGDPAPQFTLPGYPDEEFSLARHLGQEAVVLYFYPADFTPDCTREACAFRDTAAEFARHGAAIYGISSDDIASHALFADEYDLPFPLLSDKDNIVRTRFGNPDGGALIRRITYVIDRQGIVRDIIYGDRVQGMRDHVNLALATVLALESGGSA